MEIKELTSVQVIRSSMLWLSGHVVNSRWKKGNKAIGVQFRHDETINQKLTTKMVKKSSFHDAKTLKCYKMHQTGPF